MNEILVCLGCGERCPLSCPQAKIALNQLGYVSDIKSGGGRVITPENLKGLIGSLLRIKPDCQMKGDIEEAISKINDVIGDMNK